MRSSGAPCVPGPSEISVAARSAPAQSACSQDARGIEIKGRAVGIARVFPGDDRAAGQIRRQARFAARRAGRIARIGIGVAADLLPVGAPEHLRRWARLSATYTSFTRPLARTSCHDASTPSAVPAVPTGGDAHAVLIVGRAAKQDAAGRELHHAGVVDALNIQIVGRAVALVLPRDITAAETVGAELDVSLVGGLVADQQAVGAPRRQAGGRHLGGIDIEIRAVALVVPGHDHVARAVGVGGDARLFAASAAHEPEAAPRRWCRWAAGAGQGCRRRHCACLPRPQSRRPHRREPCAPSFPALPS